MLGLSWNESNTPSSMDDLLPTQVSLLGGLREVIDPSCDQTITLVSKLEKLIELIALDEEGWGESFNKRQTQSLDHDHSTPLLESGGARLALNFEKGSYLMGNTSTDSV